MQSTTIDFRSRIKQEYNVTDAQLDACQRWERGNGTIFYTVQSASVELCYYRVEFNTERRCLQCVPHSGEHCKASLHGLTCWHKRAAVAAERIYKYTIAQRRRREAEALERTAAYQSEQVARQVAEAEAIVNGAHEAQKREASATKRHPDRYLERKAFSLLK